jgi:hypothetical protein
MFGLCNTATATSEKVGEVAPLKGEIGLFSISHSMYKFAAYKSPSATAIWKVTTKFTSQIKFDLT